MKADEEQMAEALIATRKRATGSFLYRVWCECSLHPGDSNVCVWGGVLLGADSASSGCSSRIKLLKLVPKARIDFFFPLCSLEACHPALK